jgi:hypothetical protein
MAGLKGEMGGVLPTDQALNKLGLKDTLVADGADIGVAPGPGRSPR